MINTPRAVNPIPKDIEVIGCIPTFILYGRKGAAIVPKKDPTPPIINPTEIAYKANNNPTIAIKGPNTMTRLKNPNAIAAKIALKRFLGDGLFSAAVTVADAL